MAAYHAHILDTCISGLGIISDMRILFDAYQYDTDEMQIIRFHDLNDYFIDFNIILIFKRFIVLAMRWLFTTYNVMSRNVTVKKRLY